MLRHHKPRRRIGMPKGLLQYLSLKLIQREPMSGSEIMESMEEYTDWRPSPGSIYPMLARLQENGFIESYVDADPDLKRFQITEKGTTELNEVHRRSDHFGARQKSMRKMYWISILVGVVFISNITIMIESLVDYFDEIKFRGVYGLGIMVGIVLNFLFEEVFYWKEKYLEKKMEK